MAVRVRTALSQGGFALKRLTAVGFAWLAYGAICTGNRLVHGWTGFAPDIPRTWDDEAIATLEVPLANPVGSPKHVSADYYYRIPVPAIYKSYPVYAPGHEPAGYMDRLRGQEPVILWDSAGQSTLAQRRVVSQHVRAQRLVRHARGLVRSASDPRRLCADRLEAIRTTGVRSERASVWAHAAGSGSACSHRVPEDVVGKLVLTGPSKIRLRVLLCAQS
jgi:hypothetical protein